MKRAIAVLVVLVGLAVAAQNLYLVVVSDTQTANAAATAPTLASQGVDITNTQGFSVAVSAESTRTLSGGGSLYCYYYGCVSGGGGGVACTRRWHRCPGLDVSMTSASGSRDYTSSDFIPTVGEGRVYFAANSVTVSAGTTVVVTLKARRKQ